jgi:hypothetical protein
MLPRFHEHLNLNRVLKCEISIRLLAEVCMTECRSPNALDGELPELEGAWIINLLLCF